LLRTAYTKGRYRGVSTRLHSIYTLVGARKRTEINDIAFPIFLFIATLFLSAALKSKGLLDFLVVSLQFVEWFRTTPIVEVNGRSRSKGFSDGFASLKVAFHKGPKKERHKKKFVKRTNRRRVFDSMFGIPRNGAHALEDLFGNAARITTKLEHEIVAIKRTVNAEIKKVRNQTLLEQIMIGNPRGDTHRIDPKLKEFARHRGMLRQV